MGLPEVPIALKCVLDKDELTLRGGLNMCAVLRSACAIDVIKYSRYNAFFKKQCRTTPFEFSPKRNLLALSLYGPLAKSVRHSVNDYFGDAWKGNLA